MSVKANHEALHHAIISGQPKDAYGLPVSNMSPRRDRSISNHTPRGRPVCDGVRVPILKDIDPYTLKGPSTSCRFDIVEKVTTVIKAGAYGPADMNYHTGVSHVGSNSIDSDHRINLHISRQPTFHSMVSRIGEQDAFAKVSPYKWNKWVKTGKEGDARDVLYKNTFCMDKDNLRYRTLTLPRIGSDRPKTVGDLPKERYRPTTPDHMENSTGVTIVPQQPRGTVIRFRENMRPYTYSSDGKALEVKRVNSKKHQVNHFTTVSSTAAFPIIRHDSRKCSTKSDRPLKFENSRYNKYNRETLFNKQIVPVHKSAFERDYSSADTFKEYLESLQQCATTSAQYLYSRESQKPGRENSMDYHNNVLQHVKDVNQPELTDRSVPKTPRAPDNRSITIEIKSSWKEPEENASSDASPRKEAHPTRTIDNLSSVHGSAVQPNKDDRHVPGPTSSSVVNKTGMPGTMESAKEDPAILPLQTSPRHSEGGATCPTNTPTPMEDVL